MARNITKGVALVEEAVGDGPAAEKGATITFNARVFLRRGDEVTPDGEVIAIARDRLKTRVVDGVELIDHVTELGRRRLIAGIEKALYGMRKHGYREILVSPHLAYGETGVPGRIPANAMLRIQLWVRDVCAS